MASTDESKLNAKYNKEMKNIHTILTSVMSLIFVFTFFSCTDEADSSLRSEEEKGVLRMSASFGVQTRLSELPNADEMATEERGLNNVGVYIYYAEDYARGDLSKPYIRNMECTVENGELLAVLGPGQDPEDARIFIYNEMTIVAFYPYNAEMSQPENYFTSRADEDKYIITRRDYSQQYYIPYRAQTNTDPTIAYYTVLTFYPKHTYKVEIVVVSDDPNALPGDDDSVQILPNIDPVGNTNTEADGKREKGFDIPNVMPNGGGGSNVWQYIAYIWTESGNVNNIPKGEVLLQSNQLTLIASENLTVDEQHVYRYGYNMTTGEIFIPTSSQIVHDIPSLQAINGGGGVSYQACDIDLGEAGNWDPLSIFGGRFDGGGHALRNMNVNTTQPNAGLFGDVRGNATVCNINLVDPTITVNNSNAYVGGIAGRLGSTISDAEKQSMIGNLPPGLSPTVREALLQELLAGLQNTTSKMVACRVENPTITVNGGGVVGTVCGQAGEKDQNGEFMSQIWDSYSLGGTITGGTTVGGFCGLNQGYITRSYTTIANLSSGAGFTNMGSDFTAAEGAGIDDSFSELPDANPGVTQLSEGWPAWDTYQGIWPIKTTGWLNEPANSFWYSNGSSPSTYPILQWERR